MRAGPAERGCQNASFLTSTISLSHNRIQDFYPFAENLSMDSLPTIHMKLLSAIVPSQPHDLDHHQDTAAPNQRR